MKGDVEFDGSRQNDLNPIFILMAFAKRQTGLTACEVADDFLSHTFDLR